MAWTYSGDPAASEKDKYRFLIGDTIETDPVLQDTEIQYILSTNTSHNMRLCKLYETAANIYARDFKKSLGPQEQDPTERLKHFQEQAALYRNKAVASGLSVPTYTQPQTFSKGMHDNV